MSPSRTAKLDILLPTFNRPRMLDRMARSALALGIPDCRVVVLDDGSTVSETLDDGAVCDTADVIRRLGDSRVVYCPMGRNVGLGRVLERYARELVGAEYMLLVNDKDVFVDGEAIAEGLRALDADPGLAAVYFSIYQREPGNEKRKYDVVAGTLSGAEFVRYYIDSEAAKHITTCGIHRTENIAKTGALRPMGLREIGLEDAFGIDADFLLRMATMGSIRFIDRPHIHKNIVGGLTERFPVTFAYCYYLYTRRALEYLQRRKFVEFAYEQKLVRHWMRIMLMSYASSATLPTPEEFGESRIKAHLKIPLHLFILLQLLRFRTGMDRESWDLFRFTLERKIAREKSQMRPRAAAALKWPFKKVLELFGLVALKEATLARERAETATLRRTLESARGENAALAAELAKARKGIERLESALARTQAALERERAEVVVQQAQIKADLAEIARLAAETAAQRGQIRADRAEIARLAAETAAQRGQIAADRTEVDRLSLVLEKTSRSQRELDEENAAYRATMAMQKAAMKPESSKLPVMRVGEATVLLVPVTPEAGLLPKKSNRRSTFATPRNAVPGRIVPLGVPEHSWRRADIVLTRDYGGVKGNLTPMHACRLAGQYRLHYPGSLLETGYPGSGNVILLNILRDLHAKRLQPTPTGAAKFFQIQGSNAEQLLINNLDKLFADFGRENLHIQVDDFDRAWVRYTVKGGRIFGFKCRIGSLYRARFWTTHEFPSNGKIRQFKEMGYDIFFAVRHPYDIIISNMNKILMGRPQHIPGVLSHLGWFESIAENIAAYLSQYFELRDKGKIVRYEDLISQPNREIGKMADLLGVPISDEENNQLWRKYGFKELQKNHFWRPGEGKWREYLDDRHLAITRNLGFDDILNKFGYDGVVSNSPKNPVPKQVSMETMRGLGMALVDVEYAQQYNKRQVINSLRHIEGRDPRNNMTYFATDRALVNRYLADDHFWRIYAALN